LNIVEQSGTFRSKTVLLFDSSSTSHDGITESSLFNNTRGPCDWGGGVSRTAIRTPPASVQRQTLNRATILRDGSPTGSASLPGHEAQHWTCFRTLKKKPMAFSPSH